MIYIICQVVNATKAPIVEDDSLLIIHRKTQKKAIINFEFFQINQFVIDFCLSLACTFSMKSNDPLINCTIFEWDKGNDPKSWKKHVVSKLECEQIETFAQPLKNR